MTVRLTEDAHRGWNRLCQQRNVTLTAVLESMGLELLERGITTDRGEAVVERAQQIDFERRSRR